MPVKTILLVQLNPVKELYLQPSLMHVVHLICIIQISHHFLIIFFIKQSEEDVSQFDSKFTRQTPVDSPDDSTLSESANQVFLVSD